MRITVLLALIIIAAVVVSEAKKSKGKKKDGDAKAAKGGKKEAKKETNPYSGDGYSKYGYGFTVAKGFGCSSKSQVMLNDGLCRCKNGLYGMTPGICRPDCPLLTELQEDGTCKCAWKMKDGRCTPETKMCVKPNTYCNTNVRYAVKSVETFEDCLKKCDTAGDSCQSLHYQKKDWKGDCYINKYRCHTTVANFKPSGDKIYVYKPKIGETCPNNALHKYCPRIYRNCGTGQVGYATTKTVRQCLEMCSANVNCVAATIYQYATTTRTLYCYLKSTSCGMLKHAYHNMFVEYLKLGSPTATCDPFNAVGKMCLLAVDRKCHSSRQKGLVGGYWSPAIAAHLCLTRTDCNVVLINANTNTNYQYLYNDCAPDEKPYYNQLLIRKIANDKKCDDIKVYGMPEYKK